MAQKLRDYQIDAFNEVRTEIGRLKAAGLPQRVLLVLACGLGKTTIISHLIIMVDKKGNHTLFLVRKEELLTQASQRLHEHDVRHGIIKSGYDLHTDRSTYVCSTPTLVNRFKNANPQFKMWQPLAHVIVIDEAHEGISPTTIKVIEQYPDAAILGITATPQRSDRRGLGIKSGGIFQSMVKISSKREGIENGYLTDYIMWEPPPTDRFDFSGVKVTGKGEYDDRAAAAVVDKPDLVGKIHKTWKEKADGKRTLIFAQNREHGRHILKDFLDHGEAAIYVDGDTHDDERRRVKAAFESGKYMVVINVNLYIQGVDFPFIECTQIARGTASLIFWIQMTGRGDRPMYAKGMPLDTAEQRLAAIAAGPKPYCIVIDHAGNAKYRFGLPDHDHQWSLDTVKKKKKIAIPSFTTCPLPCGAVLRSTTRACPVCGHILIATSGRDPIPTVQDAVLVEAPRTKRAIEQQRKQMELEEENNFLAAAYAKQVAKGYSFRFALMQFKEQFKDRYNNGKGSYPRAKHGVHITYDWQDGYHVSVAWTYNGITVLPTEKDLETARKREDEREAMKNERAFKTGSGL